MPLCPAGISVYDQNKIKLYRKHQFIQLIRKICNWTCFFYVFIYYYCYY